MIGGLRVINWPVAGGTNFSAGFAGTGAGLAGHEPVLAGGLCPDGGDAVGAAGAPGPRRTSPRRIKSVLPGAGVPRAGILSGGGRAAGFCGNCTKPTFSPILAGGGVDGGPAGFGGSTGAAGTGMEGMGQGAVAGAITAPSGTGAAGTRAGGGAVSTVGTISDVVTAGGNSLGGSATGATGGAAVTGGASGGAGDGTGAGGGNNLARVSSRNSAVILSSELDGTLA